MKKIVSIVLAAVITVSMTALFSACGKEKEIPTIGISQYGEHASLDNCREGFMKGLEEAGLKEGVDFKVDYQNANFDDATAAQIGQNFASKDVALMCGIATPSAVACYAAAEDKDIPVIYTAISDPKQAKLTEGNVTGTSDKLPVTAQLDLIRKLQPDAKTIGIAYTTSEPNSVSTIKEYQDSAKDYGFTIEAVGVTSQAEVAQAIDSLISKKVDCISNLTDNTVVGVLPSTLEKTNDAGIPVYGSEIEQVKKGCVASAGIDYVQLGKDTGKMAAAVLKGEKKASDMPYETVKDFKIYINSKSAKALGVKIPDEIKKDAVETGESK